MAAPDLSADFGCRYGEHNYGQARYAEGSFAALPGPPSARVATRTNSGPARTGTRTSDTGTTTRTTSPRVRD